MKFNHNAMILLLVFLLTITSLLFPVFVDQEEPFGGSDSKAGAMIGEINPDYQPWFRPLLKPPGGQIESLLFSLQAAIGAGLIGYCLGFARGRGQGRA